MNESVVVSLPETFKVSKLADLPKSFVAPSEFHLARFIYKDVKDEAGNVTQARESMYAILPDVTEGFVTLFLNRDEGRNLVKDWIQEQADKAARASYEKRKDGNVHAADFGLDALITLLTAESASERLSKETLSKLFDTDYVNQIAYALVLERDVAGAIFLLQEYDKEDEVSRQNYVKNCQDFWSSEVGVKYLAIAQNYKAFVLRAVERKPTFESQAIKDKVLNAVRMLDASPITAKLIEKLEAAPVASIDVSGL